MFFCRKKPGLFNRDSKNPRISVNVASEHGLSVVVFAGGDCELMLVTTIDGSQFADICFGLF